MYKRNPLLTTPLSLLSLAALAQAQISFDSATTFAAGTRPAGAALVDVEGDGFLDLAVTTDTPDKVSVFPNQGDGTFGAASFVFLAGGSSPHGLAAADFDGDGDDDLAVSLKNTNQVQILPNLGTSFTTGTTHAVGSEPRDLAAADLNGDGAPDLVVSNRSDDSVSILLNNGSGGFGPAATHAAGQDVREVALGDWTGDGSPDVAVASHDTRQVALLTNAGNGTFGAASFLSVGAQLRPDGLGAGDLNGDGLADIVAGTSGNGFNFATVFLATGGGSFGPRVNYPVSGTDPSSVHVQDLDGDGHLDLAISNQDSSDVSLMANGGSGTFGAATVVSVGTTPTKVIGGDVDLNGGLDVVTVNEDGDTVSVLDNLTDGPVVRPLGPAAVGATTTLQVRSLGDPGELFVLGFSGSSSPGLPIAGGRVIPLTPDALFRAAGPRIGTLDGAGLGSVSFSIPNDPSFSGISYVTAFVTLMNGVDTISPALPMRVQ